MPAPKDPQKAEAWKKNIGRGVQESHTIKKAVASVVHNNTPLKPK
jgi:hypothetical protein